MCQTTCSTCAYFHQHYGLNNKKIFRLRCGHCVQNRIRRRSPEQKACSSYTPAPDPSAAFVSRDYLSHALLAYMTKLDLLPEILELQEKID